MLRFNSLMCPGLVHLYMTRASWLRRSMGRLCAIPVGRRLLRRPPTWLNRVATDRGVTTRGDDGRRQRRTEPPGGDCGEREARRGHLTAAVRRWVAHRRRPRGRRSRGGFG